MEILHFEDLGDTNVISKCSLGANLVIDIFFYVASGTSPLYKIWKQSDYYFWRYCILKIWGIGVSFGCDRSYSSHRRVSNFNSNVYHVMGVCCIVLDIDGMLFEFVMNFLNILCFLHVFMLFPTFKRKIWCREEKTILSHFISCFMLFSTLTFLFGKYWKVPLHLLV